MQINAERHTISHSPLLAQATGQMSVSSQIGSSRISIRPKAILEVVRRRGRSWGLLAQYEEGRLGIKR